MHNLDNPEHLINIETSQAIALKALTFILEDDRLQARFFSLTGLSAPDLHARIHDPSFLIAVLDFLLDHEVDLLAFCDVKEIPPANPAAAKACILKHG